MKKDSLQDLFPEETKVKFYHENFSEREFTVQKISLATDAWMLHEFGGKKGLIEVFQNSDYRSMTRIFYRLLVDEDKDFLTENVKITLRDEDGKKTEVKSNVDKLIYLLDVRDLKILAEALLKARGVSLPQLEEIADEQLKEELEGNAESL